MNQPTRPTTTKTDSAERPATVKQEDIQGMDDDVDDGGWAGAQEEVDYTAKLNFDESDEEPEPPKKPDAKAKTSDKNKGTVPDEKDETNKVFHILFDIFFLKFSWFYLKPIKDLCQSR